MILHYERLKVQIVLESQTKYVGGEGGTICMQVVEKVDNMDNINDAGIMVDIDAITSVAASMTTVM